MEVLISMLWNYSLFRNQFGYSFTTLTNLLFEPQFILPSDPTNLPEVLVR